MIEITVHLTAIALLDGPIRIRSNYVSDAWNIRTRNRWLEIDPL